MVGRGRPFVIKFHVVRRRTAGRACGLGVGNSRLAILPIELVVFKSRICRVFTTPPKPGAIVLTVEGQALFDFALAVCIGGVPAIVGYRTLIGFHTLFIGGAQLGTLRSPGPNGALLAELLGVAVGVLMAEIS